MEKCYKYWILLAFPWLNRYKFHGYRYINRMFINGYYFDWNNVKLFNNNLLLLLLASEEINFRLDYTLSK